MASRRLVALIFGSALAVAIALGFAMISWLGVDEAIIGTASETGDQTAAPATTPAPAADTSPQGERPAGTRPAPRPEQRPAPQPEPQPEPQPAPETAPEAEQPPEPAPEPDANPDAAAPQEAPADTEAAGAGQGPQVQQLGPWRVVCARPTDVNPRPGCAATQTLVQRATGAPLLIWTIGYDAQGNFLNVWRGPRELDPAVPLRLAFAGGEQIEVPPLACLETHCEFARPMSPALAQLLARGDGLTITMTPTGSAPINLAVSTENAQEMLDLVRR